MARYIGIAEETTYGTAVSPVEFVDILRERVRPERGLIHELTAARRAGTVTVPGGFHSAGDIELLIDAQSITKFLKWLLGSVTTTADDPAAPVAYKHEFTPADSLPSFTLEIGPEVAGNARQIPGCASRSLRIEAVAREIVRGTLGVLGQSENIVTESSPTYVNINPFVFHRAVLLVDGAEQAGIIEAVRLTIENDIPDDAYVLGSMFLPGIRLQGLSVSGDMDIAFTSWDFYQKFLGGTSPSDPTKLSLELKITGAKTDSAVAGFENYLLRVILPRVYLDTSEANFDARDRIIQRCAFTARHDETSGYIVKVEVINKKSEP